jgi:hypothetical protein
MSRFILPHLPLPYDPSSASDLRLMFEGGLFLQLKDLRCIFGDGDELYYRSLRKETKEKRKN